MLSEFFRELNIINTWFCSPSSFLIASKVQTFVHRNFASGGGFTFWTELYLHLLTSCKISESSWKIGWISWKKLQLKFLFLTLRVRAFSRRSQRLPGRWTPSKTFSFPLWHLQPLGVAPEAIPDSNQGFGCLLDTLLHTAIQEWWQIFVNVGWCMCICHF